MSISIDLPSFVAKAIEAYNSVDWKDGRDPSGFGAINAVAYIGEHVAALYAQQIRRETPSKTSRKPRTLHYDGADFRRDPKTSLSCWACQKDLRPGRPYREVFLVDGDELLHPDDVHRASELRGVLAWLPVGPDCAKKIGLEWTREAKP